MSKHWRPDEDMARLRPARPLPEGARAGLLLVAAACVGVAVGLYEAFGPRDAIAPEAKVAHEGGR